MATGQPLKVVIACGAVGALVVGAAAIRSRIALTVIIAVFFVNALMPVNGLVAHAAIVPFAAAAIFVVLAVGNAYVGGVRVLWACVPCFLEVAGIALWISLQQAHPSLALAAAAASVVALAAYAVAVSRSDFFL